MEMDVHILKPKNPSYFEVHQEIQCVTRSKYLTRTSLGSRPGDSYADVVFGYLMSRVLASFEASLQDHGILLSIPDEQAPALHPTDCQLPPMQSSSTTLALLPAPSLMLFGLMR